MRILDFHKCKAMEGVLASLHFVNFAATSTPARATVKNEQHNTEP